MIEPGRSSLGLTPKEAAAQLAVSLDTLMVWRKEKRGPRYIRIEKRVYYPVEFIQEYIKASEWT